MDPWTVLGWLLVAIGAIIIIAIIVGGTSLVVIAARLAAEEQRAKIKQKYEAPSIPGVDEEE